MQTNHHLLLPDRKESFLTTLKKSKGVLFSKAFTNPSYTLCFRSLRLDTDLPVIHAWVNEDYARPFWQLDKPIDEIEVLYKNILDAPDKHSLIGLVNDEPLCQADLYLACNDEVSTHYPCEAGDTGIHFLMAPPKKMVPSLSFHFFTALVELLFRFETVQRIIGEPDERNDKANRLVLKAGFVFQHKIQLSYKQANLYYCTRSSFQNVPA